MKVAGTIGNYLNQRVNSKTGELEKFETKQKELGKNKKNNDSIISK